MSTQHIVMFSGGIGSWATAKRVAEQHGTANLTLLFADTLIEDEDLYRFIDEASRQIGGKFIRVSEGRDPWQVFKDKRFIGNTWADPCSDVLKRQSLRRWLKEHNDPKSTIVYLGIDWTEEHRYDGARKRWMPWRCEAPLCDPPYKSKAEYLVDLASTGIRPPRLYELGFPHNNCGGFCIKAGQAHFRRLFDTMPERYDWHEQKEQEMIAYLGRQVSILRDRRGGKTRPMTLREFRERVQRGEQTDPWDWGGCGCGT